MESDVKEHYNSNHLTQRIESALTKSGKDLAQIQLKDLSPIDQLHTGGALSSIQLFKKVGFAPGEQVLDAGCGLGGSTRLLAGQFGCSAVGLDLAEQFIDAARFLSRCTRLDGSVSFQQGSVLDLPFDDNAFDAVLCQHILLNIGDKSTAIKEFFRVLKPGGKLILHEITRGDNDMLQLPVPWARQADISFLEPWDVLETMLTGQGFEKGYCSDESPAAIDWWTRAKTAAQKRAFDPASISPGLVFGDSARFFGENMQANFTNNSICLVEAVLKKSKLFL